MDLGEPNLTYLANFKNPTDPTNTNPNTTNIFFLFLITLKYT